MRAAPFADRSAHDAPRSAHMDERQGTIMRRLLDRLLATRARRDREEWLSVPWRAADTELHQIEKAIFRVPLDEPFPTRGGGARMGRHSPAGLRRHLRRGGSIARARGIEGQSAG
jgi:hypothetical protein